LRSKTITPARPPAASSRAQQRSPEATKPRKVRNSTEDELQVAWRAITSAYTFRLGGKKYRIVGDEARPSLFYQQIRLEIGPSGVLRASYRGRPLLFVDCGRPKPPNGNRPKKGPNAGGRSLWMRDFFDRAGPPVWVTSQKVLQRDKASASGTRS
jgi:hypothetical protein